MIAYFDTSAIVPLIVEEPGSRRAAVLWDGADRVVSSRLVHVEARAAFAMAHRMGRLDDDDLRRAVDDLGQLIDGVDIVEVTAPIVHRAGELAQTAALRAYDSVHLSCAEHLADADLVVVAGDRALLRAATGLGIAVAECAPGVDPPWS